MAHDVFISYSSKDKPIADGICASLEAAGLRCWIAPRDIAAGEDWPTAISAAISHSRVMVLIFSANSNSSKEVGREIILAANEDLTIIPYKIDNTVPEPGKQYYLARTHWLEAMNPPTKEHIKALVERVRAILLPSDSNTVTQPEPVLPPAKKHPSKSAIVVKRNWFRREYLWVGLSILVILLALAFWPQFQGMLASQKATPTLPATATIQPSSTPLPAATPTEIFLPSATPTTGTVTGSVVWGDQSYEGVTVILCSDWSIACNGLEYTAETDALGGFSISLIEPGEYQLVTFVPEQLGIYHPGDKNLIIQVNSGEMINLDPIIKCKYDLKVSAPIIKNGFVTLRWSAYPGASSYVMNIYDFSWNTVDSVGDTGITGTTYNSIEPGNYYYQVDVSNIDGGCARAFGRLTIP